MSMKQFTIRSVLLQTSIIAISIAMIRYDFAGTGNVGLVGMAGGTLLLVALVLPFAGAFSSNRDMPALVQAVIVFIVLLVFVSILFPGIR